MVESPRFRSALWGILIVDPVRGDTLYARNEWKVFIPASNQKIVTGAVALAQLGPDYRYRTDFLARGAVRDGVLRGDLLVAGRGDPSVSDRMRGDAMIPLREIADSLTARGIRRITGRVLATGDVFTDARYGEGWGWDEFDYYYSAPVDELLVNESSSSVYVTGGARRGAAPVTRVIPAASYPRFTYDIRTVGGPGGSADDKTELKAVFDSVSGGYLIRGTIRVGNTDTVDVAHHDPIRGYLTALADALREKGIAIGGARSDTGARADSLFSTMSPPMRDILPAFEKKSQNQIGEILLKTVGLERASAGTADSGLAVVRRQLLAWGADSAGFTAHDGSGLSRLNYVSPRTIVRVLITMRDSAYSAFPVSLPIAGVDGTIKKRMKGTLAEGNVRAKTGSVQRARSLSGYVTTADGHELVFSFLCNAFMTTAEEVERAADSFAVYLAGMRLGDR